MTTRSDPPVDIRLARCYRMLFSYETDPAAEWAPAWLTTLGQMDCLRAIGELEAQLLRVGKDTETG